MSGGLVPSKSTVYVSNLPFSFTNNDLYKIFEMYGKVVKVTVLKDKSTRQSKGVAFVLFLNRESAYAAVRSINNKQMFGRQLKCSIAVDNGRAAEFIRRRNYLDKTRCYECGEFGHLSYRCPKNALGEREPPKKKPKKKRRQEAEEEEEDDEEEDDTDEGEDPALDTLSAAIKFQQQLIEEEEYRRKVASGNYDDLSSAVKPGAEDVEAPASSSTSGSVPIKRKRIRPNNYFSDEEEEIVDETNN